MKKKSNSLVLLTIEQILRNKLAVAALIYLIFFLILIIFADKIAPYDPVEIHPRDSLLAPNETYIMGTDDSGRDIFSRILHGGRISVRVGFISTAISLLIGIPLGLLSGYSGGTLQFVILRAMDIMLAFPGILLALVVVSILGRGVNQVMIAVGIGNIPTVVRVVNGAVLATKESEFITAAKCIGAKNSRIMARHILPNVLAPIIVIATMNIASGLLSASSLSFLGLGAQPPSPEWGAMISRGRMNLRMSPWMSTYPGLAIASIVISFNTIGDALRDALDPWIRQR